MDTPPAQSKFTQLRLDTHFGIQSKPQAHYDWLNYSLLLSFQFQMSTPLVTDKSVLHPSRANGFELEMMKFFLPILRSADSDIGTAYVHRVTFPSELGPQGHLFMIAVMINDSLNSLDILEPIQKTIHKYYKSEKDAEIEIAEEDDQMSKSLQTLPSQIPNYCQLLPLPSPILPIIEVEEVDSLDFNTQGNLQTSPPQIMHTQNLSIVIPPLPTITRTRVTKMPVVPLQTVQRSNKKVIKEPTRKRPTHDPMLSRKKKKQVDAKLVYVTSPSDLMKTLHPRLKKLEGNVQSSTQAGLELARELIGMKTITPEFLGKCHSFEEHVGITEFLHHVLWGGVFIKTITSIWSECDSLSIEWTQKTAVDFVGKHELIRRKFGNFTNSVLSYWLFVETDGKYWLVPQVAEGEENQAQNGYSLDVVREMFEKDKVKGFIQSLTIYPKSLDE